MAEVVFRSTQHLSLSDLSDIATYVRSLPAPVKGTKPVSPQRDAVGSQGEKIYADHCAQCHGEQGQGVRGMYAALAGNRAVTLPHPGNLIRVVVQGGFAPATAVHPRPFGMPPFRQTLDDAQIAAVLTYVRQAWGNAAAPVSVLDVLQNP